MARDKPVSQTVVTFVGSGLSAGIAYVGTMLTIEMARTTSQKVFGAGATLLSVGGAMYATGRLLNAIDKVKEERHNTNRITPIIPVKRSASDFPTQTTPLSIPQKQTASVTAPTQTTIKHDEPKSTSSSTDSSSFTYSCSSTDSTGSTYSSSSPDSSSSSEEDDSDQTEMPKVGTPAAKEDTSTQAHLAPAEKEKVSPRISVNDTVVNDAASATVVPNLIPTSETQVPLAPAEKEKVSPGIAVNDTVIHEAASATVAPALSPFSDWKNLRKQ
jgi:hypothetical protein